MTKQRIGAILVLYNPDLRRTMTAVKSLSGQVDKLCLVDNTPNQNIANKFDKITNVHYIPLNENRGIATAQNIGIKYFINQGYEFVLFSDQDSLSPDGLIDKLLETYNFLANNCIKIASVGPLPYNYTNNHPYLTKQNIIKNMKDEIDSCPHNILEMYSIISSFSLIALNTFKEVGVFNESLFIDGVDDEWGWRARYSCGGRSFITLDSKISHIQGSDPSKPYKKSTPFRTYYQFRNFFWLQRIKYVPKYWKRMNWIKIIVKTFFYPIFISPRKEYLKSIINGYKDGFFKRITK